MIGGEENLRQQHAIVGRHVLARAGLQTASPSLSAVLRHEFRIFAKARQRRLVVAAVG